MIVLVGFMGSGKSTVGRLLADRLGLRFVDTDETIEERVGKTVAEVFATETEQWFRQLERDVVAEVLNEPDAVVALGGGALGDPATYAALEWVDVVHLDTSFATVHARLGNDAARPLWAKGDPRSLYEERLHAYREVSRLSVTTDNRTPEEVVDAILDGLHLDVPGADGTREVTVRHSGGAYPVLVGTDLLSSWPAAIALPASAERAFLISHRNLRAYSGAVRSALSAIGLTVRVLEIPEGERSKSLAVASELYGALAADAASRHDLIVSVGGGVISDLAGYVASTYVRGLSLVHVSTTLLGQVDAAVGGKTGVNLEAGKNLVGTFHQPRGVICDVSTLETLPREEFVSGMAEVLKYGFISDPSLLASAGIDPLKDGRSVSEMVSRCVRVKAQIVGRDERESGERAVLNYGHTFGHAIEVTSGYGSIRHGEAVALGMMAAAHLAHVQGRIGQDLVTVHRGSLEAAGLPTAARLDLDALSDAWRRDKKYEHGPRFVLLDGPGKAVYGVEASEEELREALRRMER
jgi:shikimate kinase/3-dehydroquinate synthase